MDHVLAERAGDDYLGADTEQQAILWSAQDKTEATFPNGDSNSDPVREAGVFTRKKVLLGQALEINAQTKEALDQWITTAGGVPLSDESEMSSCDVYITKWRDGPEYSQVGSSRGKSCAYKQSLISYPSRRSNKTRRSGRSFGSSLYSK
jgi:hypothetical protein